MIAKTTKKLIIVCDEKTEIYANYLRQLISTNDDKEGEIIGVEDGTVDVAVWLDKDYIANKAQLSSNEHILFIGNSKVSQKETSSMTVKFEQLGMKYGWLGKRGMLKVDYSSLSPDQYNSFIDLCQKYETEFEKIVIKRTKKNKGETAKAAGAGVGGAAAGGAIGAAGAAPLAAGGLGIAGGLAAGVLAGAIIPVVAVAAAYKGINEMQIKKQKKQIRDQQYRAATVILYIDGLQEFLEG